MFALWAILVASVLCESLAKKWQIWVRFASSCNLLNFLMAVDSWLYPDSFWQNCSPAWVLAPCNLSLQHTSPRLPRFASGVCCWCCIISGKQQESSSLRLVRLILSYPVIRFSLGSFFAPVALQVMYKTHPENYKTPIYTQARQKFCFL